MFIESDSSIFTSGTMKNYKISRMDGKRILITGGLGFIGSNLALKLTQLGARPSLMTKTKSKFRNIKGFEENVDLILGDIADRRVLEDAVRDKDVIFHLAGQTSHISSMEDPVGDVVKNCEGTMNVLEACRKHNDEAKIMFPGTTGQLGKVTPKDLPITENLGDHPITVYDADKLAAEKYLLVYNQAYGMRTTSIRLSTIYGERQEVTSARTGITNNFIKRAISGEEITVYGDGMFIRDYNHVSTVVDAFLLAAQTDRTDGHVFNLGSNVPTKFIEMVKVVIDCVKEITGKQGNFKFVPWPENAQRIDVGDVVVDFGKLNQYTGWYPNVTLKEGVERTVEFYKERIGDYL
jgi:UDP-glucose 4-epimerase